MKRLVIIVLSLSLLVLGMSATLYAGKTDNQGNPEHRAIPATSAVPQHNGQPATRAIPATPAHKQSGNLGQPPLCLNSAPGQPECILTSNPDEVCCTWDTTTTSSASKYSLDFDVAVDTSDPIDCVKDVTEEVSFGTSEYAEGQAAANGSICIPWNDFVADLTGTPVSATAKVKGLLTKGEEKCRQKNVWSITSDSLDLGCVVPVP